jgi:rRNA maturation endonuclease Nob1
MNTKQTFEALVENNRMYWNQYKHSNWCVGCRKWTPKPTILCPYCGYKMRTNGRTNSARRIRDGLIKRY